MRKSLMVLAVASATVVPLWTGGVAQALDDANTQGTTTGRSVLVTDDADATCKPTAPTQASDAFCHYVVTGSVTTTKGPTGPATGSYRGNVILNYGFAAATESSCASAKGVITFFVRQGGKPIGQFSTRLKPATADLPNRSKVCSTGQSPADSDVASSFFSGTIFAGKVSGFPVCGSTENKGSSIKNLLADGTLSPNSRDASNSTAALGIKSGTDCNYPPAM